MKRIFFALLCAITLSSLTSCNLILYGDGINDDDIIGTWEANTYFDEFIDFAPSYYANAKTKSFGYDDDLMVESKVTFRSNGVCRWRLEAYYPSDPYHEVDIFGDTDFEIYYFYDDNIIDFSDRYEGGTDLGSYDVDFYGYDVMEMYSRTTDMTFYRD